MISNTRDSVSSAIQTPRNSSKILRCASYFQLSSRCLDIPMKHCLSCLIYYLYYLCLPRKLHRPHTNSSVDYNLDSNNLPLSHKNIEMITCARTTITIRTVKRTFALDLDKVFMLKSYINPWPERFTLSRKRGKWSVLEHKIGRAHV